MYGMVADRTQGRHSAGNAFQHPVAASPSTHLKALIVALIDSLLLRCLLHIRHIFYCEHWCSISRYCASTFRRGEENRFSQRHHGEDYRYPSGGRRSH